MSQTAYASAAELSQSLKNIPGFADAHAISQESLSGFDIPALQNFYRGNPSMILNAALVDKKSRDLDATSHGSYEAIDMAAALQERYGRTHILCLGVHPLMLAMVTLPEIAGGVVPDLKISVIQRIALSLDLKGMTYAKNHS